MLKIDFDKCWIVFCIECSCKNIFRSKKQIAFDFVRLNAWRLWALNMNDVKRLICLPRESKACQEHASTNRNHQIVKVGEHRNNQNDKSVELVNPHATKILLRLGVSCQTGCWNDLSKH